ncbi:LysR family transcriptional regulator [Pendulispora albinea]|uniref:LysR family transcriptional regulator n=1 Tax=Pendulispora albinea TaxID=2741071 RepID=A0ABZ2LRC3_9BACT
MLDNRDATDLNAVTIFLRIAEAQTFRGAAKALGIPASTVSAKLAQLENDLGVRLFERTTRVVRLTDAGRRYRELATPAVEALVEAKRALSDLHLAPSGLLRVTAPMELGQFVFGPVLTTYLGRYPDVRVHVDLTSRHVNLVEEGFDIALRAGGLRDSSLIARALGAPHTFAICASRAYLARHGTPKHPRDLARHACLLMHDHQVPAEWEFAEGRRRIAVHVRGTVSVNSFSLLRELAIAGLGIARLPRFVADPAIADGSLRVLLRGYSLAQAFHALYPSSRHLSPRVRTFLEVLELEFRRAFR